MKTKKELKIKIGEITHPEIQKLDFISKTCESLIEKKVIDENTLREVDNLFSEIMILKDTYTRRLISLLKQNHMID